MSSPASSGISPSKVGAQDDSTLSYIVGGLKSATNTVTGWAGSIWGGVQSGYESYAPNRVKQVMNLTGSVAKTSAKVAVQGMICLDEFLDVANMGGTKNPQPSIDKSWERLSEHNIQFANCVEFLANKAAQAYVDNEQTVKDKVCKAISGDAENADEEDSGFVSRAKQAVFNGASSVTGWFLSLSKELIGETIKANIMNIAANLADEAYDEEYEFEDNQLNPFGRILSVIGNCFEAYEDQLSEVADLPEKEQLKAYLTIFDELSADLLGKLFPKGERDLQLFHHTIPFMKLIKGFVWEKLNKELPGLLMTLYLQTRPLEETHDDWKEQFDAEGYGFQADQLLRLPSNLLPYLTDNSEILISFESYLIKSVGEICSAKDSRLLSENLVKFAKEFLTTEDPALHKMGAFFERYLMERVLFNLSQYAPEDDETPMPLYVLKTWIEGDVFKVLSAAFSGANVPAKDRTTAVDQLLAPFGLNQEESFPLPKCIKELAWSAIQDLLTNKAPTALFDMIPKWMALKEKAINEKRLTGWLQDSSLSSTLSNVSSTLADKVFESIQATSTIAKQINDMLPSESLSSDQQESIDEQWTAFLKENQSMNLLKTFGHQCIQALMLQISKDLYKNYQKAANEIQEDETSLGLQKLFGDVEEDEDDKEDEEVDTQQAAPSFAAWLLTQMTEACQSLSLDELSANELEAFERAIQLKNAIRDAEDPIQVEKDKEELEKLWVKIEPKFQHVVKHLMKVMGYQKASDLPIFAEMQSIIWKTLNAKMPYILFEQAGDLMLPLLEKEKLQAEIEELPEGETIKEGCQLLAQDIVSHLPEWLKGKMDALPQTLEGIESGDVDLSDKARDYLATTVTGIVNKDDPAYEPVWQWLESYLEGLFLKVASKVGKMDQKDIQELRTLAQNTKEALLELEQAEQDGESDEVKPEEILADFADELFETLGIETETDLFGIPQALQGLALKEMKAKVAQALLGLYSLDRKIRNHVVEESPVEEHLPASEVARAALAMTRFVLDKTTDKLTERDDKGQATIISKIYNPLNVWLGQMAEKEYQIAGLFQDVIGKGVTTPLLVNLFDLLDAKSARSYKHGLADWINPMLTTQVINHLTPFLEKEKEGQADFDRAILMALLPVINKHLKHLNQASAAPGGLNYANFIDAVGDELHAAVPVTGDGVEEENVQRQEHFYKDQTALMFDLMFPNGKADLAKMLPDLEISDEQYKTVLEAAQSLVSTNLPIAVETLFDKEMMVTMFSAMFETIIDNLSQPVVIKPAKKQILTEEELAQQKAMDEQVGQLVMEAAKFMDMPAGILERIPGWSKRLTGIQSIENSTYESIGAMVREQFDGEFFAKTMQKVLPKLAEQEHVKKTPQQKMKDFEKAQENLKDLENQLAQVSLDYTFRFLRAKLVHATDIFTNPVAKFFRAAILALCSFVFVTLLGSTLRFLKIERFFVNRISDIIHHGSQKTQMVFAQPKLHEDLVYQGVEAFEKVLIEEQSEQGDKAELITPA